MGQKNKGTEKKSTAHQSKLIHRVHYSPAKGLDQTTYSKQGKIKLQATLFAFDCVGSLINEPIYYM